jgi:isoleucyl-tRNA synthetase
MLPKDESLCAVIAEEVNVKSVLADPAQTEEVVLDTTLTPELKSEGWLRESVRMVQDLRKTSGLTIDARPILEIRTTIEGQKFVEEWKAEMMRRAGLADVRLGTKPEAEPKELPFPFEITLH